MDSFSFHRRSVSLPSWLAAALLIAVGGLTTVRPAAAQAAQHTGECSVIEDFEAYQIGDTPYRWKTNKGRSLTPADKSTMVPGRNTLVIRAEEGDKFVRMKMNDYAYRLIKRNGGTSNWNIEQCPVISWQWRVKDFPEGASEDDDDTNDVAAAFYVTFGRDWLGRPISIKYTYSSTLPVGTVVDYGPLMVLVVDSALGPGDGEWKTVTRNVIADFKQLFGEPPETNHPLGIQLFSDADDVPGGTAVADFDDVRTRRPLIDRG